MGVSVENHLYTRESILGELNERLAEVDKPPVDWDDISDQVAEFGNIYGDNVVILWNEYYEDYNPCSQFLEFFKTAYGLKNFWPDYEYGVSGIELHDLYEKYGIEPEEDDYY